MVLREKKTCPSNFTKPAYSTNRLPLDEKADFGRQITCPLGGGKRSQDKVFLSAAPQNSVTSMDSLFEVGVELSSTLRLPIPERVVFSQWEAIRESSYWVAENPVETRTRPPLASTVLHSAPPAFIFIFAAGPLPDRDTNADTTASSH